MRLIFIFMLLIFSTRSEIALAKNSFYMLSLGIGRQGVSESQAPQFTLSSTEKAIIANSGQVLSVGMEYWLSPNMGLGVEAKRIGKRKTTSVVKDDSGPFVIFYRSTSGSLEERRFVGQFSVRFDVLKGRLFMMGSYGRVWGKVDLKHESVTPGLVVAEELDESGKRWRLGLEYFFQKESGFRLSYSSYDMTWDESRSLALTGQKAQMDFVELILDYVFQF